MKAIELIRVSTEAQAGEDRASIPSQRSVNRTTAARYGLEIVRSIELTDVSGASVLLSPEMQELIQLIQSPSIEAVVTREFSRLMRPEKFSDYALLQAFADSRTKLFMPDGPIDFSEKSGRLMGTIRAAIAGLERSEIQERCWRGKEEKRKAGKNVSATLPLGVSYDKQRGYSYNAEMPRVRKAFEMILSGITNYAEVCRRTGISRTQVFKLLRNPIWTGWRVYEWKCDPTRRMTRADGRQGYSYKIRRDPGDVIRVRVIEEPMMTDQQFQQAQRIMDAKRDACRRERNSPSLYGGFVFCGLCGAPLIPIAKNGLGTRYYICRDRKVKPKKGPRCEQGYLRAEPLEELVNQFLLAEFSAPIFASQLATELTMSRNSATITTRIERLETELRGLESRRSRLAEAFLDGILNKESCQQRIDAIRSRVETVSQELADFRSLREPALAASELSEVLAPFMDVELLTRGDRRRLLALTAPKIFFRKYSISKVTRLSDSTLASKQDPSPSGEAPLPWAPRGDEGVDRF